ncbi:hypothetical protein M404DRAFT_1008150 [Pisolithus tinctorius Marx 270]|uniref:Uncharacterized protein n=1 Tax=Pisolithus tinctorius Marx 270 TaxID=870435 RepID=A0A0C3NFZ5_PISTI|nr:hypothetical protein M404DRAFT_1008150 [Pisolithus tinctorius Marx 270]
MDERTKGHATLSSFPQLPYFWVAPTVVDWSTPIAGIVILSRMGADGQHDHDASSSLRCHCVRIEKRAEMDAEWPLLRPSEP